MYNRRQKAHTVIRLLWMIKTETYKQYYSIAYAEYGDQNGYPILINHGLIASIKVYEIFERLIGDGARLICIARPGYGASSPYEMKNIAEWADLVRVVVDALQLAHFDVLGMSSGAPYSYAIAYQFPTQARNIYIFSGIPAMDDEEVLSFWPFPVDRNASIPELQKLARDLFFANGLSEDCSNDDLKDSRMNDCFGIALDFKLRCHDWGFPLSGVSQNVFLRHSKGDQAVPLITAELTAKKLPNCRLAVEDNDIHFSKEALDDFIKNVIVPQYKR